MSTNDRGMPLTCPGCGRRLRLPAAPAGRAWRCPACGAAVRTGQLPTVVEPPAASPAAAPGARGGPAGDDVTVDLGGERSAADEPIRVLDGPGDDLPRQIGRYRIVSEIARGGMGVVYRAHDPHLGREVALKVLLAGEGASRETVARFAREARAAAGLKHPGIVQVHDFGEAGGQHFFTMDLVDGRPLDQLAGPEGLAPEKALEIVLAVARALQYAHGRGVIHRDLKPANILVTREGAPVLTDFGLAKQVGDTSLSMTGTVFGTPAYMSPEQAQGQTGRLDARSDVYSLGAVLYELLARRQPFSGETVYDVITQVIARDPPAPSELRPELPPDISTVCMKAMEKDPARRYRSMAELAADLEALLSGRSVSARAPGALERLARWLRRNARAAKLSAGSSAAAAAAVLGLWLAFGQSHLDALAGNLTSGDAALRLTAARTISAEAAAGRLAGRDLERAERLMVGRLADADAGVRLAAIEFAARRSVAAAGPELVRLVRSEPGERLRLAALRARPPGPPAGWCDALLELAGDRAAPRELRLAAVRELGPVGGLMVKIPLLRLKLANHDDRAFCAEVDHALLQAAPRTVLMRVYRIAESGGALRALAGAVSGLQGRDDELGRLIDDVEGGDDPQPPPKKSEPLGLVLRKLSSPEAASRLEAVADLGTIGHRDCLPPLLRALRDADADVALAAAEAAAAVGLGESVEPVLAVLRDRALPAASRGAAAHLLGLAKIRSAAPAVAAELGAEKNARAAELMVRALGRLGERDAAEPALAAALGEGAPPVRAAAAEALGALGSRSTATIEALVRAADDPEKRAADAARAALGSITGRSFASAQEWRRWWQESRADWK